VFAVSDSLKIVDTNDSATNENGVEAQVITKSLASHGDYTPTTIIKTAAITSHNSKRIGLVRDGEEYIDCDDKD
jgi:hypothetical protein